MYNVYNRYIIDSIIIESTPSILQNFLLQRQTVKRLSERPPFLHLMPSAQANSGKCPFAVAKFVAYLYRESAKSGQRKIISTRKKTHYGCPERSC